MIWTIPEGRFLVQGESHPIYLAVSGQGITLPTGEVIHSAHVFYEITASGEVVKRYAEPFTSCLDDYLYVTNIHVVIGSELHELFFADNLETQRLEDKALLKYLTAYKDGALPFDVDRVVRANASEG